MTYLKTCFEQENKRWNRILDSPQKLKEHLSKRLDSDKMAFSSRLTNAHLEVNAYVTIPNIHCLLLHKEEGEAAMETLTNKGDQRSHELPAAFRDGPLSQPSEQLGDMQGTFSTYLEYFLSPEISEVFCANRVFSKPLMVHDNPHLLMKTTRQHGMGIHQRAI